MDGPIVHLQSYVSICIHLQEDDGGQYRCTARNEAGEVSLTMNLDIASPISVGKYDISCLYHYYQNAAQWAGYVVHPLHVQYLLVQKIRDPDQEFRIFFNFFNCDNFC